MTSSEERPPLPVAVVGGFLGSGKTTLVNHLLRNSPERRIGVLVNDFGDVAIDADLIVARSEDVLTLANGCICCSLRGDLTRQVMALAEDPARPEHLIIEASGVSDPGAILSALLELERFQVVRLDVIVVTVDAEQEGEMDPSAQALARRQLQAADLVVLTKTDLVSETRTAAHLERLSIDRRVLIAPRGAVEPGIVLGFEGPPEQLDAARAGREAVLRGGHQETLEGHEGWASQTLRTREVFDFRALVAVLKDLPDVYRAKGFVHARERPGNRLLVHLTGRRVQVRTVGTWDEERPESVLVFIGRHLPVDLETRLMGAIPASSSAVST